MIKRFALSVVVLLAVVPVAVAGVTEVKPEQERLTAAGNKIARAGSLKRSDFGRGWRTFPMGDLGGSDAETDVCPGYDVDQSAYTIVGRASAGFMHAATGAVVFSVTETFATAADAAGDFRNAVSHPLFLECARLAYEQEVAAAAEEGVTMQIVSMTQQQAPKVGKQVFAYRAQLNVEAEGVVVPLYADSVAVQKGRSITMVTFMQALMPYGSRAAVARKVALRMR